MNQITEISGVSLPTDEAAFDPIEDRLRVTVRATVEAVFEEELSDVLGHLRYGRGDAPAKGNRHCHRAR